MSDASRTQLLLRGPESVWGEVAPANPPTIRLRPTSANLKVNKATVVSDEIRSDRQRTDLAMVGLDVSGDINFEASYGNEFDLALQAALGGTWGTPTANLLRNGVVNRSYGIEEGFLDLGKYVYHSGCILSRLMLDISARQIVKVQTSWMGKKGLPGSATIVGSVATTAPTGNAPMKAGSGVSILSAGTANVEMVGVSCRKLTLDINQGLRARQLATSEYPAEPGRNVQEITGTIEVYFDEITRLQAFIANQFFAFKLRITDLGLVAVPNTYEFTLPTLKIPDGVSPEIPGNEADIYQTFNFRALLDPAVGYTVNVERGITV